MIRLNLAGNVTLLRNQTKDVDIRDIRLITLDYWSTIVDSSVNAEGRKNSRYSSIYEVAKEQGVFVDNDLIASAFQVADRVFHESWEKEHRTPPTKVLTHAVFEDLGIHLFEEELGRLNSIFERSLLAGPPELSPGVSEFLATHQNDFNFAIISDTQFSPGYVIREYLDIKEIGQYFDFHAFSDEIGKSKPDPKVFELIRDHFEVDPSQCMHVGDLLRTDIDGANKAGWTSILYTGIRSDDYQGVEADHVCESWSHLSQILNSQA